MKNNAKKYSIVGIIIVLLILIGAFALLGSSGKDSAVINSSSKESATEVADNSEIANNKTAPVEIGDSIYSDAGVADVGESEISGVDEIINTTDIAKLLIPIDEKYKTGMYGEKKVEGPEKYYRILSFIPEKELSFAIGYMEGCESGCSEENCPNECLVPANWIETKRFIPTQRMSEIGSEGNFFGNGYRGFFVKVNDPNYETELIGCGIDLEVKLTSCTFYGVVDDPGHKRFGLKINPDALTITLR